MTFLGFHSFAEANVYITFVLLGMSVMMMMSAILGAPDFINNYYKYATGKQDAVCEKPRFWDNALTFFLAGVFTVQFICESLTLTHFIRRIPLRLRLIIGLCVPFIEMFIYSIIPVITIPTQDGAIVVVMILACVSGFSKAMCDSTTNAIVGPFPTKFMNGEQWGLTISPLMMSIVEIILKATMSNTFEDIVKHSHIYLGIAMFFQFVALVAMLILDRNPFAQKYNAEFRFRALHKSKASDSREPNAHQDGEEGGPQNLERPRSELDDNKVSSQPILANIMADGNIQTHGASKSDPQVDEGSNHPGLFETVDTPNELNHSTNAAILKVSGDADKMVDIDQKDNVTSSDQMLSVNLMSVIKRVWPMLLCTFFIYFMSLLLFPGLFLKASDGAWYSTLIVAVFNLGDFLSRIALMYRPLRPSPKCVIFAALVRLIIIPLLILCSKHVIKGVILPFILCVLLSLTNGYYGTMACISSPRTPTLTKAGERSLAGILSGLFLMLGLAAGTGFAVLLNLLI